MSLQSCISREAIEKAPYYRRGELLRNLPKRGVLFSIATFPFYRNALRLYSPEQHPSHGPARLIYALIIVLRFYMVGEKLI